MLSGFPPEFTLAKVGVGMTTFYEAVILSRHEIRVIECYPDHFKKLSLNYSSSFIPSAIFHHTLDRLRLVNDISLNSIKIQLSEDLPLLFGFHPFRDNLDIDAVGDAAE
jgi:hypothetical protein